MVGTAAFALLFADGSGAAQAPAPAASAPDCAAVAAERSRLDVEHAAVKRTIADIALGKTRRHRSSVKAGDVAGAAAGTAASLLLPFGIGLAVNAATAAASKAGRKPRAAAPPDPGPDVPALIERQHAIEARLTELAALPCAAPPPAE